MEYISLDLLHQIEGERKPGKEGHLRYRPMKVQPIPALGHKVPKGTKSTFARSLAAVVPSPSVHPLATFGSIASFYLYEKRHGGDPVWVTGNFQLSSNSNSMIAVVESEFIGVVVMVL